MRDVLTEKLWRNETCWCGSGKKFKRCHLNRAEETPENPFAVMKQFERFNKKSVCLHPESGPGKCSDKIVRAHTIQRGTSLSRIAESGHVLDFSRDVRTLNKTPGKLAVESIGINKASTFNGFCGYHDNNTFAPVEDEPFTASEQQCFLLGYRAMCRELYQKETVLDAMGFLRGQDKGRPIGEQAYWQSKLSQMTQGYKVGYRDLQQRKADFDAALLSGDFSRTAFFVVETTAVPDVMASFGMLAQFDFDGNMR